MSSVFCCFFFSFPFHVHVDVAVHVHYPFGIDRRDSELVGLPGQQLRDGVTKRALKRGRLISEPPWVRYRGNRLPHPSTVLIVLSLNFVVSDVRATIVQWEACEMCGTYN